MQKVDLDMRHGWRRFRHVYWMRRWAQKRRRTGVVAELLQENSSLTMVACALKERLSTGMKWLSEAGKQADVHTILVSASRVHSKGTALLQRSFDKSFNVRPYLESGTYIGHTQNQAIGAGAKQPRTLFSARETTVGGDFGTLRGVSPMASVGEVPSCPLAQSSAKKLQTRLVSRASGGMERMPIEKRNC